MLIQIWMPDRDLGMKLVHWLERNIGFYDVPELAEWYHPHGYIMDISPAPVREQDESFHWRQPGRPM